MQDTHIQSPPAMGFVTDEDRNQQRIVDEFICVLLKGGGFRPCRIVKVRSRLGSEIYAKLVSQQEPYQSWSLAEAEAREWAELEKVRFIDWP